MFSVSSGSKFSLGGFPTNFVFPLPSKPNKVPLENAVLQKFEITPYSYGGAKNFKAPASKRRMYSTQVEELPFDPASPFMNTGTGGMPITASPFR